MTLQANPSALTANGVSSAAVTAQVQAVDFADTEHFTVFEEFFREHHKTRSP